MSSSRASHLGGQRTIDALTFILDGPESLVSRSLPVPVSNLRDDELACRTEYSAVSPGTELSAFVGLPPLRPDTPRFPRKLGYMNVGRVIAAGTMARLSTPVGTLVYTHAEHCDHYLTTSREVLAVLPSTASPSSIAPIYLYRLAWNALRRANAARGADVAVVGLGAIGIATTELARFLGYPVMAMSDNESAHGVARYLGAEPLTRGQTEHRLRTERAANGLADVVVVTTNSWSDWELALALTKFNGVVSVLGFPGRGFRMPSTNNPLSSEHFYDRQLWIAAAGFGPDRPHAGSDDRTLQDDVMQLVQWSHTGDLNTSNLVHQVVPAHSYPDVLSSWAQGSRPLGTVVLDWREAGEPDPS